MAGFSESTDSTAIGGESNPGNAGSNPDPASPVMAPKWDPRFEEAEMPSYDHITATEEGVYRCNHWKCRDRDGFPLKALLR
jgi:hypothetical protein